MGCLTSGCRARAIHSHPLLRLRPHQQPYLELATSFTNSIRPFKAMQADFFYRLKRTESGLGPIRNYKTNYHTHTTIRTFRGTLSHIPERHLDTKHPIDGIKEKSRLELFVLGSPLNNDLKHILTAIKKKKKLQTSTFRHIKYLESGDGIFH